MTTISRYLLVFAAVLLTCSISAQTEMRQFDEIAETKAHIYTFTNGAEFGTYDLRLFDREMNLVKLHTLSYKKYPGITAYSGNDDYSFFYINHGKVGDLYRFDKNGEMKVLKDILDDKSSILGGWIKPVGSGGCVLVRSMKPKKLGFEVTYYDDNLNVQWTKMEVLDKGRLDLIDVDANDQNIDILYTYKKSGMANDFILKSRKMNMAGDVVFDNEIGGENSEDITHFVSQVDGSAIVIGYYGRNKISTHLEVPVGLYCGRIAVDGAYEEVGKIDFKEQFPNIKTHMAYDGREDFPLLIPELIVDDNGTLKIFSESCCYQKIMKVVIDGGTPQPVGSEMWLLDAVTWEPVSGQITVTGKAHRHIIFASQVLASFGGSVNDLREDQGFGLIGYADGKLLFHGWHRQFKYVNWVEPGKQPYEDVLTREFYGKPIYQTRIVEGGAPKVLAGRLSPYHASTMAVKEETGKPLRPLAYSGAFHKGGTELVIFDYNTMSLQLTPIQVKFN